MAQAIVDPAELRRFALNLKRFNVDVQTNLAALHSQLLALGDTWRDQEHEHFRQEFEQTMQVLEKFLETADLAAQVRRMIRDAKSASFLQGFAEQWLTLRKIELSSPDPKLFPDFNLALRQAMRGPTPVRKSSTWPSRSRPTGPSAMRVPSTPRALCRTWRPSCQPTR